jgi:FHA domain
MNTTTTHDPHGGGHPRLVFALGGDAQANTEQREFELLPGVTVIGSGADADLRLAELDEHHAEVRRDAADEYVYADLGTSAGSRVNGQPAGEQALHTGDRIELGHWTLSFSREEFADHGRPYGGRQGGEWAIQRTQEEPRARGTSADGGSDRKDTDPASTCPATWPSGWPPARRSGRRGLTVIGATSVRP